MAIKFPLKMSGVDVRNLDDLRKNFDLNAALDYFRNGKLLAWLEARYYDDEAEEISALNENAPDFREKFCKVLGVEMSGDNSARLTEKISRLRELTDDEKIISNANVTALTQEDLAELLDAGVRTIFLCGEKFSVPIRVRDKNYIGVLDAPTIKIRATSPADLDAQNIRFDNVILPWDIDAEKIYRPATEKIYRPIASTPSRANDELRDTFEAIFGTRDVWSIIADYGRPLTNPSPAQKKFLLKMICGDGYTERDLIHLRVADNFSAGWALTRDAFCVGGDVKFYCCDIQADDAAFQSELNRKVAQARQRGRKKILYRDISDVLLGDLNGAEKNFGGGIMDELLGYNLANNFDNDSSFMRMTTTGRMIIFDRDDVAWGVTCVGTSSPSMTIKFFDGTSPRDIDAFGSDVLDAVLEEKLVKFLDFVRR